MTDEPYTIELTRGARRALAEKLPLDVANGAVDLLAGALSTDPHRVGKPLDAPLDGIHSARLMREWRVLYVVDDAAGGSRCVPSSIAATPTGHHDRCRVGTRRYSGPTT